MKSGEQPKEPQESFEQPLFRAAEAQIEAEHHILAVVIAQVAIEATVEIAFTTLFSFNLPRSFEALMAVLPDRSFQQQATRRLWTDLTGDTITKGNTFWKPYTKHVERRNNAVHGAIFGFENTSITREHAEASIDTARKMTAHIFEVVCSNSSGRGSALMGSTPSSWTNGGRCACSAREGRNPCLVRSVALSVRPASRLACHGKVLRRRCALHRSQ